MPCCSLFDVLRVTIGVQRAEAVYRRCLAVNPEHGYALYNLAVLKEETTKNGDYSEVGLHAGAFLLLLCVYLAWPHDLNSRRSLVPPTLCSF